MRSTSRFSQVLLALALIGVMRLTAQASERATVRVEARLVLVPVTVVDHRGATITGLDQTNFTVWDDKVPQRIVSLSAQDEPCSVGIVLDTSGSMRATLQQAADAVRAFLRASNPQDEFFMLTVSTRPVAISGFTQDAAGLEDHLRAARAEGSTALIDTVYMAIDRMRCAENPRRALVVISDGMDNHSRYTQRDLMRVAVEADVQIYTVAMDSRPVGAKPLQLIEVNRGLALLRELAEKTGGVNFTISMPNAVSDAASKIGRAIRNQYIIGFEPANHDLSGKWRRIRVDVNYRGAKAYARNGYYSQ
jgi:Ca-activated chloride channel family protein